MTDQERHVGAMAEVLAEGALMDGFDE